MEGLTPEEANAWTKEMQRITTGVIRELITAADKHNIDRDSAVQYFSDMFGFMVSISTFEQFKVGDPH